MSAFRSLEVSAATDEGLRFVTVRSPAIGHRADITLFVPPEARDLEDIPIVLLLHGAYASHWAWALSGGAHRTAASMIGSGDLPPVVLAMPSDGLWGDGSGYLKHPTADYERWIVDDVPAAVREIVPAASARSPLCIAGLSIGGFGALRLAGRHRSRFRAACGHSSVTALEDLRWFCVDQFDGCGDGPSDHSVLAALTAGEGALPPIRFDCGIDDALLPENRELHRALLAAGIEHEYEERPGGHDWNYWSTALPGSLQFIACALRR